MRRFRLFDLCTPWFWIVAFFRRQYGKPMVEVSVYDQRGTPPKWWVSRVGWEDEPDPNQAYEYVAEYPNAEIEAFLAAHQPLEDETK